MEQKADGHRILVYKHGDDKVFGISRSGKPLSLSKEILAVLQDLPVSFILDGELIRIETGVYTLVLFDILRLEHQDLRDIAFKDRKALLQTLLPENRHPVYVMQTVWSPLEKQPVYDYLEANGAEGVIFKHRSAKYVAGRPPETGVMWFRKKWTAVATVQVVRQDPTKRAVFYRYADTGEIGSVAQYPNRPLAQPNDLLECSYLYADTVSQSLIQPVCKRIRTDVSGPDHSSSLQYKAAARWPAGGSK